MDKISFNKLKEENRRLIKLKKVEDAKVAHLFEYGRLLRDNERLRKELGLPDKNKQEVKNK